jgi:hypothetical protein
MESGQEPSKNQLDPQEDVRLLGKPVGKEKHEEGKPTPEDQLRSSRNADQPAPGQQPDRDHQR